MKLIRKLYRESARWLQLAQLSAHNLLDRRPITGDADAVVSLTTYGNRARFVHLAIESIARSEPKPRAIILWLDEMSLLNNPPRSLKRLTRRGLELRPCPNYGPHKKYYPYVSRAIASCPLLIVDDDFIYPKGWLSAMLDSYRHYPDVVTCTRAHRMGARNSQILPYRTWTPVVSSLPSYANFPTGIGGVLYPPGMQRKIASMGTEFMNCAPRADDIWLHYVSVLSGYPIRQISNESLNLEYRILPFAQGTALHLENVNEDLNDVQIARTYDDKTIGKIELAVTTEDA